MASSESREDALIVWTTVPKKEEGEKLAKLLLQEKLAACVHVMA
ncbi:divalent cation tolerance protein CutA, partial [Magnetococcales bacterium HHB-1]